MLESQILECLELGPKTRAELARWCGYATPGYAKNHPFRRALEALISRGDISSRKAKFRLTSTYKEKQENLKVDGSAISFSGPLDQTMSKAFARLKRVYPHLHSKCNNVIITVRSGEIQLQDFSDELGYEDIKFLKEFLSPYILEGEDAEIEDGAPPCKEEAVECLISSFMNALLGGHAKLVQSIHLKNDDWEFKISKPNTRLRITTDSAGGFPISYSKDEESI